MAGFKVRDRDVRLDSQVFYLLGWVYGGAIH